MKLPQKATLVEVGPRDGFQPEARQIPTDLKIEMISGLVEAGLKNIQVTSFVHPRMVPQMADAEEICSALPKAPDVEYSALVLNLKGIDRAVAAGIESVDVSISTSDTHSRKNANMPLEDARKNLIEMIKAAKSNGLVVRAGLQCAFGCNYEGVNKRSLSASSVALNDISGSGDEWSGQGSRIQGLTLPPIQRKIVSSSP